MMKQHQEEKLNSLSMRISKSIEGEDLLDIATVCARLVAFAINESYDSKEQKFETLGLLIEFMRKDLHRFCNKDKGEPNGQSQRTTH
jgi:hypothetical protein